MVSIFCAQRLPLGQNLDSGRSPTRTTGTMFFFCARTRAPAPEKKRPNRCQTGLTHANPCPAQRPGSRANRKSQGICKPGSVHRAKRLSDHSSRTTVASRLKQPTRTIRRKHRCAGVPAHIIPIRPCSWRGLPCACHCWQTGALLPHPFTLAWPQPGGLLSVALSLGLPPPGVTRRHAFVEPGLSSRTQLRSGGRLMP